MYFCKLISPCYYSRTLRQVLFCSLSVHSDVSNEGFETDFTVTVHESWKKNNFNFPCICTLFLLSVSYKNKWPTCHKAHQSSGLELLSHVLSHLYKLTENIPLQTPSLTVYGADNKIYNYFPHFDCNDKNKDKLGCLFSFFSLF